MALDVVSCQREGQCVVTHFPMVFDYYLYQGLGTCPFQALMLVNAAESAISPVTPLGH